jgi:hypothetical protein
MPSASIRFMEDADYRATVRRDYLASRRLRVQPLRLFVRKAFFDQRRRLLTSSQRRSRRVVTRRSRGSPTRSGDDGSEHELALRGRRAA